MADEPKTGRELLMQLESNRDEQGVMARYCVDEAMEQLGLEEISGREFDLGRLSAILAARWTADAILSAQRAYKSAQTILKTSAQYPSGGARGRPSARSDRPSE